MLKLPGGKLLMALRVYKVPGVKIVRVEWPSVIVSGKEIPALGWSLCYGPSEATENCEFPSLPNLHLQPCPPSWDQGAGLGRDLRGHLVQPYTERLRDRHGPLSSRPTPSNAAP